MSLNLNLFSMFRSDLHVKQIHFEKPKTLSCSHFKNFQVCLHFQDTLYFSSLNILEFSGFRIFSKYILNNQRHSLVPTLNSSQFKNFQVCLHLLWPVIFSCKATQETAHVCLSVPVSYFCP